MQLDDGVNIGLDFAKTWSKYVKDIISYVDKRATLGKYGMRLTRVEQSCITCIVMFVATSNH